MHFLKAIALVMWFLIAAFSKKAGKGVQYSSVFIKGSNEQSEVGMFSHSPYLAVVRFLYKSLKPVFD